jgi:hypothetical protein
MTRPRIRPLARLDVERSGACPLNDRVESTHRRLRRNDRSPWCMAVQNGARLGRTHADTQDHASLIAHCLYRHFPDIGAGNATGASGPRPGLKDKPRVQTRCGYQETEAGFPGRAVRFGQRRVGICPTTNLTMTRRTAVMRQTRHVRGKTAAFVMEVRPLALRRLSP